MSRRITTPELKVAEKMSALVNDLTLDLDQVGRYIAREPAVTYRRVMEIAESAKYEREGQDDNYIR